MTSKMKSAYQTTGAIFKQASRMYSPGLADGLAAVTKGEIVVVSGVHDHIEKLLDTLNVPYTMIGPEQIATHNGGRVMFVNCREYGSGGPRAAVRQFVGEGGRLVTTDWALSLVTHAFPGKLSKMPTQTGDEVVEIQCLTDIARRWTGQNYAQCSPKWWLEGASHVYDVGQGVVPIITSDELKERHGKPYIASAFSAGRGEVVHFISHLELQRTRQDTKADNEGLEAYLEKMGVSKTAEMEDAKVAELEAAFSTLNTLAYLCIDVPVLGGGMKSTYVGSPLTAKKSVKLTEL